jgi:hypothetical protein
LLKGGGEGGLGFGETAEMKFSDGLTDNGERGGGARSSGELLVDVEGGLILLATLKKDKPVSLWFGQGSKLRIGKRTTRRPTQDSARLTRRES